MSGLTVSAEEYPTLSRWLLAFVQHDPFFEPDSFAVVQQSLAEAGGGAKARQGLAMALGDCIQAVANWPPEAIAAFNAECASSGLPSLADIQLRFWKTIRNVQARGHVRTKKEYYALREAAEMMTDEAASREAWKMLWAFEEKLKPPSS